MTTYHRKSPLGVFCGSFQGDFIRSGVFTGPYPLIQRREVTEAGYAAGAGLDLHFCFAVDSSNTFYDRQRVG